MNVLVTLLKRIKVPQKNLNLSLDCDVHNDMRSSEDLRSSEIHPFSVSSDQAGSMKSFEVGQDLLNPPSKSDLTVEPLDRESPETELKNLSFLFSDLWGQVEECCT